MSISVSLQCYSKFARLCIFLCVTGVFQCIFGGVWLLRIIIDVAMKKSISMVNMDMIVSKGCTVSLINKCISTFKSNLGWWLAGDLVRCKIVHIRYFPLKLKRMMKILLFSNTIYCTKILVCVFNLCCYEKIKIGRIN